MEIKSIFTIYQICRLASGVRITPWRMTLQVPFQFHTISRLWPQNEIWFLERNTSEAKWDNLRMEFHLVVLKVLSQTTTAWDHVVRLFHWQRRNWSSLAPQWRVPTCVSVPWLVSNLVVSLDLPAARYISTGLLLHDILSLTSGNSCINFPDRILS